MAPKYDRAPAGRSLCTLHMEGNVQFGLLVAILIPGFIGLTGVTPLAPVIAGWLNPVSLGDNGFGPPVYAVLAATACGMILSAFRWLLVDGIHHRTGVTPPRWDDRYLEQHLNAFSYLVESHYRYYQFYANTLIAVIWAYSVNRYLQTSSLLGPGTDLGVLILCAVLFASSRDSLAKYYAATGRLLCPIAEKDCDGGAMTNGRDHDQAGGAATKPAKPEAQSQSKPATNGGKSGEKK